MITSSRTSAEKGKSSGWATSGPTCLCQHRWSCTPRGQRHSQRISSFRVPAASRKEYRARLFECIYSSTRAHPVRPVLVGHSVSSRAPKFRLHQRPSFVKPLFPQSRSSTLSPGNPSGGGEGSGAPKEITSPGRSRVNFETSWIVSLGRYFRYLLSATRTV